MSIPQQIIKYDRWSDKIIEMKMKCERRRNKCKECKKIADLRKIKKKIRKNMGIWEIITTNAADAAMHIEEEKLEQNTGKLVKTV